MGRECRILHSAIYKACTAYCTDGRNDSFSQGSTGRPAIAKLKNGSAAMIVLLLILLFTTSLQAQVNIETYRGKRGVAVGRGFL